MAEVRIDDVDATVTYAGDWQSSTDMRSYQNTIHFTNSLNSEAKLTFTGIRVAAYGVVRASETPQSSYTLDGGDPTILQSTSKVISQYGVLLYTSPVLPNGQHNLVITNLGNGSTFFLDSFTVTGASSSSSSSSTPTTIISPSPLNPIIPSANSSVSGSKTSSSSSISSSGASSLRSSKSGPSSSVGGGPLPASTASGATNANSAAGATGTHHTAAIIGGVSALVVVLCFIIVYIWLQRRRRRKKEFESWIINSFSGGAPSLPVVMPQTNEDPSQFPPGYAWTPSEPPAYDPITRPEPRFSVTIGRGVSLRLLEKGSIK